MRKKLIFCPLEGSYDMTTYLNLCESIVNSYLKNTLKSMSIYKNKRGNPPLHTVFIALS